MQQKAVPDATGNEVTYGISDILNGKEQESNSLENPEQIRTLRHGLLCSTLRYKLLQLLCLFLQSCQRRVKTILMTLHRCWKRWVRLWDFSLANTLHCCLQHISVRCAWRITTVMCMSSILPYSSCIRCRRQWHALWNAATLLSMAIGKRHAFLPVRCQSNTAGRVFETC